MKALVTTKYKDEELKSFEDLGYEIVFKDERELEYSDEIKDIDVLITAFPFEKLDIDLLASLKWIQLLTVGINQIPVEKLSDRNIIITNNRGGYSIPISEWIVLKILEMIKNSKEFSHKQKAKNWDMDISLLELYGKTVGFIGTGSIATEAAKRLEPFGVEIIGVNSSGRDAEYFHKCYSVDEINKIVPECDFILVATPYTEKTHHLIDESVFASMKNGTYLINIARGSILDENALTRNLESGKIKKAALDVFEEEPLPDDNPLWEMENTIITPHNSWASEMFGRRRYEIAYTNMKKYINNEELVNVVDLERGY